MKYVMNGAPKYTIPVASVPIRAISPAREEGEEGWAEGRVSGVIVLERRRR